MAEIAILKIRKIVLSHQKIDQSLRNLAQWCKMGLFTIRTIKKFNFKNPRRRVATILETIRSPYLFNRSTDFDEIWHADAEPV